MWRLSLACASPHLACASPHLTCASLPRQHRCQAQQGRITELEGKLAFLQQRPSSSRMDKGAPPRVAEQQAATFVTQPETEADPHAEDRSQSLRAEAMLQATRVEVCGGVFFFHMPCAVLCVMCCGGSHSGASAPCRLLALTWQHRHPSQQLERQQGLVAMLQAKEAESALCAQKAETARRELGRRLVSLERQLELAAQGKEERPLSTRWVRG